jgi:hypothetical protein
MNTTQIERILSGERRFQGVYSLDTLPTRPRLLICNTDPSTKPGQHWIAIYVDENGYGEYFDSFGRAPNEHFKHYLNANCRSWTFNKRQLQSIISAFCGFYCCVYVKLRCRGMNMPKIVAMFTSDTAFNDMLVHRVVCNKR